MSEYLTASYNLTTDDVAEILGYHPQYVRILAKTGKLPALKRFRQWWFCEEDMYEFLADNTKNDIADYLAEMVRVKDRMSKEKKLK